MMIMIADADHQNMFKLQRQFEDWQMRFENDKFTLDDCVDIHLQRFENDLREQITKDIKQQIYNQVNNQWINIALLQQKTRANKPSKKT